MVRGRAVAGPRVIFLITGRVLIPGRRHVITRHVATRRVIVRRVAVRGAALSRAAARRAAGAGQVITSRAATGTVIWRAAAARAAVSPTTRRAIIGNAAPAAAGRVLAGVAGIMTGGASTVAGRDVRGRAFGGRDQREGAEQQPEVDLRGQQVHPAARAGGLPRAGHRPDPRHRRGRLDHRQPLPGERRGVLLIGIQHHLRLAF